MTELREAVSICHRLGFVSAAVAFVGTMFRTHDGKLVSLSKARAMIDCDHKFVDSVRCLKCGWLPQRA